ncbi:MAG: hypothetical protein AAFV43_15190 [Planctomycetota bacterium]
MPPSRDSNPFSTCWTGTQSAEYVVSAGPSIDRLLARLEQVDWRGQILGPHGAGKSILLRELRNRCRRQRVRCVEGFEKLPEWRRRMLVAKWRITRQRVVVTTHERQLGLPIVARVRPSERVLESLFLHHTVGRVTPVSLGDARAAYRSKGGDLRAVWLELHLLHECRSRGVKPIACTVR